MKERDMKPNRYRHLPTISRKDIDQLQATNHVVAIDPRKKMVCVDGSTYYQLGQ
jgi:hypothetical protein